MVHGSVAEQKNMLNYIYSTGSQNYIELSSKHVCGMMLTTNHNHPRRNLAKTQTS